MNIIERNAEFSPCGKYRYQLWRKWDKSKHSYVLFICLNPSTADVVSDDQTILRCMNFEELREHGALCMVNLFAFRATDSADMKAAVAPIGPKNDETIIKWAKGANVIIAAWGNNGTHLRRNEAVISMLNGRLFCLGTTKHGHPRHPLYLKKSSQRRPFA